MSMNKPCDLCTLLAAFAGGDDAALIWRDERLSVVLVDEPDYPGFCRVVWNAHVKEMSDLSPEEREHVMRAVWQVELAQREVMAPHKVNVASLGNMTPHVHWHVIPRYTDDAHFPHPVWGARQRESAVQAVTERGAMLPALRAAIIQRLSA